MAKEKEQKPKKGKDEKGSDAQKKVAAVKEKVGPPRLQVQYKGEIIAELMKKFQYRNVMQVPRLEKISVNMGVGKATQDPKMLDQAVKELEAITGQKVVVTKAKKSISNFKLREGLPIGCRVTLRKEHMYEFFDRLVSVALPRVRDFRGLSTRSFDGRGSYTLGLRDQLVFPEIDYAKVDKIKGMNISIVTDARTDAAALALLRHLGMPFRAEAQRRQAAGSPDEKAGG